MTDIIPGSNAAGSDELFTSDPCADLPTMAALPRNARIRVVELLASGTNGGAQEHVRALVAGLPPERYTVHVVSLSDGPALVRMAAEGMAVEVLAGDTDAEALEALIRLLRQTRPQILHAHMFRAELLAGQALARLALISEPRPFLLASIHSSRVRSRADQAALAAVSGQFSRLIAVSEAMVAKLKSEGRTAVPIDLIYNGIDLARFGPRSAVEKVALRARLGYAPTDKLVGSVGRLEPEKGHQVLLAAWPDIAARDQRARLLLVGDGSQREALEGAAAALGEAARSVRFLGWHDEVASLTGILDLAVLPSYREALGLAVIEALASGRPVVASAVGGIPELIKDGQTGLLVPPGDSAALAKAITRLLEDPAYAARLGVAGQRLVHERFCLELMIRRIAAVYDAGALAAAEVAAALDPLRPAG
jgi:glycosyltransferase involved in cell wall biosynthesis